jgi:hypothetical protein
MSRGGMQQLTPSKPAQHRRASSWSLTFCRSAVSASICFCRSAIVASCSSFLRCLAGKVLRLIQIRFSDAEFGKDLAVCPAILPVNANRGFEFHKRGKLFIRTDDEPPSVVAMCVSNENSRHL